jgi:hypothetical protein
MSGGIAILILNFGSRCRWGCALPLRPEKDSQLPAEFTLVGPQIRSVCSGEEQHLLHLPGIEELQFLFGPANSLTTAVVTLSRLLILRF